MVFETHNFNALYLPLENPIIVGRVKCCGMEDLGCCCRKTKKLICGMEAKNVVAHGCQSSTARSTHTDVISNSTYQFIIYIFK